MVTLRGQLRYGWLGKKATPERDPARFILFVPGKPGLKVVAQDGSPLAPEHLISSVNLRVEVRGTEVVTHSGCSKFVNSNHHRFPSGNEPHPPRPLTAVFFKIPNLNY